MIKYEESVSRALETFTDFVIFYVVSFFLLSCYTYFFIFAPLAKEELGQYAEITFQNYFLFNFSFNIITSFFQTLFVSLSTLLVVFTLRYEIGFGEVFKIVFIANCIFIGMDLCRVFWFEFFETSPDMYLLKTFSPLSISSALPIDFRAGELDSLLRDLNLFRALFTLLIALGLSTVLKTKFLTGLVISLLSSFLPFLMWNIFLIASL